MQSEKPTKLSKTDYLRKLLESEELRKKKLKPGDTYFVISKPWFDQLRSIRARLVDIPEIPHLKNNVILKLNQKYWNSFFNEKLPKYSHLRAILKDEASRGKEYEIITEELWKSIT